MSRQHSKRRLPVITSFPLRSPDELEGDRKVRVEVLHDTLSRFENGNEQYIRIAGENLSRWTSEARSQRPRTLRVYCVQSDLLAMVMKLTKQYGVLFAALNMANESHPGGGYTTGAAAQEENMARRTYLHNTFDQTVLTVNRRNSVVYTDEMQRLISGVDKRVYLSKDPLVCIRGEELYDRPDLGYELYEEKDIFPFLELRSAAVNTQAVRLPRKYVMREMERRIDAQFATLIENGVRHVVLSAFGCGAFRNDPTVVAALYRNAIARYAEHFSVIAFAIYYAGHGENNFPSFKHELSKLGSPLIAQQTHTRLE